jgi:hypothetical protein
VTRGRVQPWIGLVEVRPSAPALLDGSIGGYANVVALVASAGAFREAAERALRLAGLHLVDAQDVEPLAERLQKTSVHPEVLALVSSLRHSGDAAVDEIHSFLAEE